MLAADLLLAQCKYIYGDTLPDTTEAVASFNSRFGGGTFPFESQPSRLFERKTSQVFVLPRHAKDSRNWIGQTRVDLLCSIGCSGAAVQKCEQGSLSAILGRPVAAGAAGQV
jgi:hypothetical protein